jgi:hypothetical protein
MLRPTPPRPQEPATLYVATSWRTAMAKIPMKTEAFDAAGERLGQLISQSAAIARVVMVHGHSLKFRRRGTMGSARRAWVPSWSAYWLRLGASRGWLPVDV